MNDDIPSSQRTNEDPAGPVSVANEATLILTPHNAEARLAFSQVSEWLLEQDNVDSQPQSDANAGTNATRQHAEKYMSISKDQSNDDDPTTQTYFMAVGRIDYFIVEINEGLPRRGLDTVAPCGDATGPPPSSPERQLSKGLREDIQQAGRDLDAKAAIVEGPGPGRADKQRWLVHTGFLTHLEGLADAEIQSSFQLPKATERLGEAVAVAVTLGKT
ncbi:uncharacterized protein J7T54_005370 [Emericellopsis cladophorae]|uniref:Uncharacterized protein n=1 Tax=Emericellopsis cladophorae TaxID=2686198 RepID=A0A9P9XTW8_9HYPO|nr:uncharacterized protein J7T54_005370 [Emericellopsis cladophorae]KAI6777701.1 hypothetical protein J7T54_005370 [Emericellopsis cladophorae]